MIKTNPPGFFLFTEFEHIMIYNDYNFQLIIPIPSFILLNMNKIDKLIL